MSELMVLLQALLLIAGWLLFLRAQTELRAQAARQSLTGELEELRQTVDALLHKLAEEAAQAEARIEARLKELERRSTDRTVRATHAEPTPSTDRTVRAESLEEPPRRTVQSSDSTDRSVRATHVEPTPSTDRSVHAMPSEPSSSTDRTVRATHAEPTPSTDRSVRATHAEPTPSTDRTVRATQPETFTPDSGYNLTVPETSPYGVVAMLAEQGLSVPEIARQTGYAPGEVELILSLKRRSTEENG